MALKSFLVPAAAAALLFSTLPSRLAAAQEDHREAAVSVRQDRLPQHQPAGSRITQERLVHRTSDHVAAPTTVAGLQAATQTPCGKRADIVRKLGSSYKETQQSVGRVSADAAVEVFVSQTGSWTILATGTDGTSCLMAVGDGWDTASLSALPGS